MTRTIVIGAGVIGLACAYSLKCRGVDVVLVEMNLPGQACSKGNCGWVTPSISSPIPAPGLTWTSIKWMLKSDSPLYISPVAVPSLARWLWQFWRHCNTTDFLAGLNAVSSLNQSTFAAFAQLERDGVQFEFHRDGLLFVFKDESYMEGARTEFEYYKNYGYEVPERLSGDELRRLEPALSRSVTSGFLVKEEAHVRPESLVAGYLAKLKLLGVEVKTGSRFVSAATKGRRVTEIQTEDESLSCDNVLIAAGAWSGKVTKLFGVTTPVQAGKGYSVTVSGGGPKLVRPLYLGEARIGCSPYNGAVRFAGTMELSGINMALDRRRVTGIRNGIREYLAEPLGETEGIEWVGMRPLTPDGLPLLGKVPRYDNLFLATGHAMLGVTLAPATGELMADLIAGEENPIAKPFDPGRFNW